MAQTTRMKRRSLGMLTKRLSEARLDSLEDPRDRRGRRWSLTSLLSAALLGLVAGCRSLKDVEALTDELAPTVRSKLGIPRRVSDTTLRDALVMLAPDALRPALCASVRAARRRKALEPSGLPFGVVALDGKATVVPACDGFFAQRQTRDDARLAGAVRTITASLVSASALKASQSTLFDEAVRWLGVREPEQADATTADVRGDETLVRRLYLGEATAALEGWDHLRTVLRVETETLDAHGARTKREDRYFLSSLPRSRLTAAQWLLLVRRHWGVETSHQILDVAFAEDDHPWIEQKPTRHRGRHGPASHRVHAALAVAQRDLARSRHPGHRPRWPRRGAPVAARDGPRASTPVRSPRS